MHVHTEFTAAREASRAFSVLVADPRLVIAETICAVLSEKSHCTAKGVDSLDAALAASVDQTYDLFFYDCSLPGCFGLDRLKYLISAFPDTGVVLFSKCSDTTFLASALNVGLRAYVPKTLPLHSFLNTVDLLKTGEVFVPAETIRDLRVKTPSLPVQQRVLKEVEHRILGMIESGLSNREIGLALAATENQVKMRLRTLYGKIGANNRIHALRIARSLGEM